MSSYSKRPICGVFNWSEICSKTLQELSGGMVTELKAAVTNIGPMLECRTSYVQYIYIDVCTELWLKNCLILGYPKRGLPPELVFAAISEPLEINDRILLHFLIISGPQDGIFRFS
jgi:hypothetical protein